ncbi:zinc-binding dehydrogenase [Myroides profundi]|nr:zinc-binding dehydrogenase [Myroides profundi]AJH15215.1 putative phosphonate catabolism associated alcohol dehydrogenase [Myroides profundi]
MKQKTATAMVFDNQTRNFKSREVQICPSNQEEIIVQVAYTTICSSDLHTYCGRRSLDAPTILGHEIIGYITHLPPMTTTDYTGTPINEGDLITWCIYAYDSEDAIALEGYPQKSASLYKYGHHPFSNTELNGGFATHCILKKGTAIFKLPTHLTLYEATPLNCSHATIAGAMRLAGDVKDKTILVYGAGMLGLSAIAMSKAQGAKHIIVCDVNEKRLSTATLFGATHTFQSTHDTESIKQQIAQLKINAVLDTTGIPAVMEQGIELSAIGATNVWIGAVFNQSATQINAETIIRKLITIKGLHNYTPDDLKNAVAFLSQHHNTFPFKDLAKNEFALEQLEEAFDCANKTQQYRVGIKATL